MDIFLIYGGKSAEHDISIISAFYILKEIFYDNYQVNLVYISREGVWLEGPTITDPDQVQKDSDLRLGDFATRFDFAKLQEEEAIAFPVLHGPNGEDGTVQGLFEVLNVPYVGCGVLASSTGMDKIISKALFEQAGIPQLPYQAILYNNWVYDPEEVVRDIESHLSYPIFVKPANMGSSVGISQVHDQEELKAGINLAFEYDHRIVVEEGVTAREIEMSILGNEDVHTSVPGELVKDAQFYDYAAKYENNTVQLDIPAKLDPEVVGQLKVYATKAFLAIDGSGLTRADFFVTEDKKIYINEVNTFPGFTTISMYPKLWEETGLSYKDLIEELIQLGLKRHRMKQAKQLKDR